MRYGLEKLAAGDTIQPIRRSQPIWVLVGALIATDLVVSYAAAADPIPAAGSKLPPAELNIPITAADLTPEKVGKSIPASAIGEPVSAVNLNEPRWVDGPNGGYGLIDGMILPVDPESKPINFRVALPGSWSRRSAQIGGGGMNGSIPNLTGRELIRGYATYGSDSGHQGFGFPGAGPRGFGGPRRGAGGPGGPAGPGRFGGPGGFSSAGGASPNEWSLNEEAIKNFGYMQMKKTHDAAMIIVERVYGERPRFNYYFGASQGGREALTVAQRYPADYDGIVADVPIVNFSSLMLGPVLIRIQEKRQANWVPRSKVNAIRAEFMRQADKLDGLEDGIMNNYMAARRYSTCPRGQPIAIPGPRCGRPRELTPTPPTRRRPPNSPTARSKRSSSFTVDTSSPRRWPTA